MAKVYRAPFDAPPFRRESWREDEARYIADLRDLARNASKHELVGEIVSFQVADGFARYMVWSVMPFALVHIDTMDGYQIPEAHARGLRLADIKRMLAYDKRVAALFAEKEGNS
jgi:hypothetical protein